MGIEYVKGAECILKHCHDLHEKSKSCKRKFVRATLLSPSINGITRLFSRVNGPVKNSFKCSGELASCGCMHSEPQIILDLVKIVPIDRVFQYIMLVSYSPCTQCANSIIHCKFIDAVIYDKILEHDLRGVERLQQVMPVLNVDTIKEIIADGHRGELSFIKRWGD